MNRSGIQDGDFVAFVAQSRPYPASDVLTGLIRAGMTVTERPVGEDAIELLSQSRADVVILAIDPERAGDMEFLRAAAGHAPGCVVVLVPQLDARGVSAALDAGADVWLTDDDCPVVFEAQIRAIRRRMELVPPAPSGDPDVLISGPLRLDYRSYRTRVAGKLVPLTPLEFKILAYLVKNEGTVVPPVAILQEVQDYEYPAQQAREMMKVHVRRIRAKLGALLPDDDLITNVRGIGYLYERGGGSPPANGPRRRSV